MRKAVFTVGAVLRGDDAAGPMLAKMLEDGPIEGWEIIDGGQMPEDMLAVVRRSKPDFLLLVDAADMGEPVGTLRVLSEDKVMTDYLITTHSLPLTFLLGELREYCSGMAFVGIQPGQTEFMASLSASVLAAVEALYGLLSQYSGDVDIDATVFETFCDGASALKRNEYESPNKD